MREQKYYHKRRVLGLILVAAIALISWYLVSVTMHPLKKVTPLTDAERQQRIKDLEAKGFNATYNYSQDFKKAQIDQLSGKKTLAPTTKK